MEIERSQQSKPHWTLKQLPLLLKSYDQFFEKSQISSYKKAPPVPLYLLARVTKGPIS